MKLGMYTEEIVRPTVEELFQAVRGYGFGEVQFDFVSACGVQIPERIDDALVQRIHDAADHNGVVIRAVNGTFNMIHPDKAVRKEGLRRFEQIAQACEPLGCNLITLCTGSRDPDNMWAFHPDSTTEEAFSDLLDTTEALLKIAGRYNLFLGVETEPGTSTNSPRTSRRLLDHFGSPRLKIIMDCANLFGPGRAYRQYVRETIKEAFDYLEKDIILAHGKDIKEGPGVSCTAPGRGIVDYDYFLERLRACGYEGPMILHGIKDEADFPASVAFMKEKVWAGGYR